jgi:hypothetical protein
MSTAATVDPDLTETAVPGDQHLSTLSLEELRLYRRQLLSEAERALRWRRLVQARLDLVVAGAAPADDLTRPSTRLPEPPDVHALRALVAPATCQVDPADDAVGLLRRLAAAQRALAGYGTSVQTAASEATRELVDRYARDPRGCLSAVPPIG